ncbi:MAG: hypothetical protein HOE62_21305 [Alphaproteobacteria bacterium]|nr:hypothetical protein [Alphaproteobacteria bacterium]
MTFADAVKEISAACGRHIQFSEVSHQEYKKLLEAAHLPDDHVWLVMYLFTTVMDGRNEHLNDGIEQALGRPPKDFTAYARDVAQSGAWALAS